MRPVTLGATVLGIAVLFLGQLGATGLQAGALSLADVAVRIAHVLGLLGGLTVQAACVLRVVARLRVTRLLAGSLDIGWIRLPCLPVLVVGRLLAGAVDALAALALLPDGELSRVQAWAASLTVAVLSGAVLSLRLLLTAQLLLRGC